MCMALSFPNTFKGRPLIFHPNEKLEFRFIANQRFSPSSSLSSLVEIGIRYGPVTNGARRVVDAK